jgi:hypothetical protein
MFITVQAAPLKIQRVDDDQFSKDVSIVGAELYENPFGGTFRSWALRSWVDKKTGATAHQIYVVIRGQDGFAGYFYAADDTAEELEVTRIGLIDPKVETVGIGVGDAVLRARAATGYAVKLKAKNGDALIISVSPEQIRLQLAEVDQRRPLPPAEAERRRLELAERQEQRRLEIARQDDQRRAAQQRDAAEAEALRPMLEMVPSIAASWKGAALFTSDEPSSAGHPGAAVLGVACVDRGKLVAVTGTEFATKKTWSIGVPITDVRFYFDGDETHRNWEQFSPTEAGPLSGIGGFVEKLGAATELRVAFERVGKEDRERVTFRLDDPQQRDRLRALLAGCK